MGLIGGAKGGRKFFSSRIGRGATVGRALSSRDQLAGYRARRVVVKPVLRRIHEKDKDLLIARDYISQRFHERAIELMSLNLGLWRIQLPTDRLCPAGILTERNCSRLSWMAPEASAVDTLVNGVAP